MGLRRDRGDRLGKAVFEFFEKAEHFDSSE
jgi:hypothetical protein